LTATAFAWLKYSTLHLQSPAYFLIRRPESFSASCREGLEDEESKSEKDKGVLWLSHSFQLFKML
jgi:hypothetical protein